MVCWKLFKTAKSVQITGDAGSLGAKYKFQILNKLLCLNGISHRPKLPSCVCSSVCRIHNASSS